MEDGAALARPGGDARAARPQTPWEPEWADPRSSLGGRFILLLSVCVHLSDLKRDF